MADNVAVTAGSGTTVATDDVSGVHYQYVKIADGTADSTTKLKIAAEDAAHSSGDTGIQALAVRKDTAAALAGTDGDYAPLEVDATGRLHVAAGATENVIGLVGASDIVVTVTPTLDTSAYASGDLLFDSTEAAAAARTTGGATLLESVTIIDKADQKVAFTLVFANAATDFGTANSAPNPDDTETATIVGHVAIAATDYLDMGGASVACIRNLGLLMQTSGTTSLWIAGVNSTGTPTYAASDLVFYLGFLRS